MAINVHLNKFKNYQKGMIRNFKNEVAMIVEESGGLAEQLAKQKAPHDLGYLAQNIGHEPVVGLRDGNIGTKIYSNAPYSAYHEFGTGTMVDVPDGWHDVAIQFKGKGIRQVNIKARPFLIPSVYQAEKFMRKKLSKLISTL